jgi:homoserine kinase
MATVTGRTSIVVPATSANLGPGFDVVGMALQLYNTVTVEVTGPPRPAGVTPAPQITVEGEGADSLGRDARNLVYRSVCTLFERASVAVPAMRLQLENRIPVGRGLGSSAAAIAGGLVAANALLGERYARQALLACALTLEPHPDNLAAALYGGVAIAVPREGALPIVRTFVPARGLSVVLLIPEGASSTAYARTILRPEVTRADAVFNMGRTALLLHALGTGEFDLLGTAMEDRLHQPQRGGLFPALPALIGAARDAGAYGAALSGAGSTVLALTSATAAEAVAASMLAESEHFKLGARTVITEIAVAGAGPADESSPVPATN